MCSSFPLFGTPIALIPAAGKVRITFLKLLGQAFVVGGWLASSFRSFVVAGKANEDKKISLSEEGTLWEENGWNERLGDADKGAPMERKRKPF
jgi:hypothetical protein